MTKSKWFMNSGYEYKKIHDAFYPKIIRYLTGMVGPNEAEDVAQNVFEKISRNLDSFQGRSKLSTWIYRIAANAAMDHLRSTSYKQFIKDSALEEASISESKNDLNARHHAAADQKLIGEEMSACVREFVNKLPPNYRTVIVLSDLEGLANQDIADILEISLDNVKIRLHRARAKLKEVLNGGCDFYYNEQSTLACDRKQPIILPKVPK